MFTAEKEYLQQIILDQTFCLLPSGSSEQRRSQNQFSQCKIKVGFCQIVLKTSETSAGNPLTKLVDI